MSDIEHGCWPNIRPQQNYMQTLEETFPYKKQTPVKEYTVGFAFSEDRTRVVLVKKERPPWQEGFWNGVGGKVENSEPPRLCMVREFAEETGVTVDNWELFATIGAEKNPRDGGDAWKIYYYRIFSDKVLSLVNTVTDEEVRIWDIKALRNLKTIYHLDWMIPMALHSKSVYDIIERV